MLICKIEEWINNKLCEPIDSYNEYTYEWSRGYKKALTDIIQIINKLKINSTK